MHVGRREGKPKNVGEEGKEYLFGRNLHQNNEVVRQIGEDGREQLIVSRIIHKGGDELKAGKEHWNAAKRETGSEATDEDGPVKTHYSNIPDSKLIFSPSLSQISGIAPMELTTVRRYLPAIHHERVKDANVEGGLTNGVIYPSLSNLHLFI